MHITKVVKDSRRSVIDKHSSNEITEITEQIVSNFQRPRELHDFFRRGSRQKDAVQVSIEIATGVLQRSVLEKG